MITYSKQAIKYLNKTSGKTRDRLDKSIASLSPTQDKSYKSLEKKKALDNAFIFKTEHYRIIYQAEENNIHINCIDTKTNMKMRKTGLKA